MSDRSSNIRSRTLPKVGDVLSCRFPLEEAPMMPGPKARPVLVIAVTEEDVTTVPVIKVAFGTSRPRIPVGPWLRIQRQADREEAGVRQSTLFLISRNAWLPFSSEFFSFNRRRECRLGRVPSHLMRYVRDGLPRFNGEALDIAISEDKEAA